MAEALKDVKLSQIELLWLKKCVDLQRAALTRSRGKEIVGSEIYGLRTKELEALGNIALKLS